MRKNALDNVEIVEPPIGELTKQTGSVKRTFLTGCGCVIFLLIFLIIGVKIFVGPGPKEIKLLPKNFPESIPVYEKDSIESVTFISGKYKNRSIEIAAFFPKIILSPMLLKVRNETEKEAGGFLITNKNFWKLLTTPVGDSRDTVQIQWENMDADPNFIISYYKKELDKKNFTVSNVMKINNSFQITFEDPKGISGTLYAEEAEDHSKTSYAFLTVNIPLDYQNNSLVK